MMKSIFRTIIVTGGVLGLLCCTAHRNVDDPSVKEVIGKTVEDVLLRFGVSYDSLQLHDEPPGNLASVSFSSIINSRKEEIRLWIASNQSLFSIERKWDPEIVKKAIVVEIRLGTDKSVII